MKAAVVFLVCAIEMIDARRIAATLTPSNGNTWGEWGDQVFCPSDAYVSGFELKVQGYQRGGDNTALNAIALYCSTRSNGRLVDETYITSATQRWGSWNGKNQCSNGFLTGIQTRNEPRQGSGDDTAMNDVRMKCQDGDILSGGGMHWGSWGGWLNCGSGRAICGLQTRVERAHWNGDDSALNNVRVYCCDL